MAIICIQVVVYTHSIYHGEGGFHHFSITRPVCRAFWPNMGQGESAGAPLEDLIA